MPPITVMIKPVSGACNMRCRYCFYNDVMARRKVGIYPRMTREILEIIVRKAFLQADSSVHFILQGGEPTLIGLEFLETLIALERKYNARALTVTNALQTNGYQLPDEMIAFFARERFLLGLSMDGCQDLHDQLRLDANGEGTFERVQDTARRLTAADVDFNILCVVNDQVAQNPQRVFQALAPYGYIQFVACLDDFDRTKQFYSLTPEHYRDFLKTTFDLYYQAFLAGSPVSVRNYDNYVGMLLGIPPENCAVHGQCGQYFLIESDGSVYPCDFYVTDEWCLGNIQETSFRQLVKMERALRFRKESLPVPESCRGCCWYPLCRNGCKRERDPQTGLNIWCESYRDFFAYSISRMEKMARGLSRRE